MIVLKKIFSKKFVYHFKPLGQFKRILKQIKAGCATQDFRNPDCAQNTLGERLEGYLKIAINRFRANSTANRLTRVSEIQKLMKENEFRLDSPWNDLLKCKKDPQI